MFLAGDESTSIRLADFLNIIPAITGKVELVYEGEQEGAENVAEYLIGDAIISLSEEFFPKISNLEKPGVEQWYQKVVDWFVENEAFELGINANNAAYGKALNSILPLDEILNDLQPNVKKEDDKLFLKELILWMLVENEKLSKAQHATGYSIKDNLGDFLKM